MMDGCYVGQALERVLLYNIFILLHGLPMPHGTSRSKIVQRRCLTYQIAFYKRRKSLLRSQSHDRSMMYGMRFDLRKSPEGCPAAPANICCVVSARQL